MKIGFILALGWLILSGSVRAGEEAPDDWTAHSPREEIRPAFQWDQSGDGSLVIRADEREGLVGYWSRTIPVEGTNYYHFCVDRTTEGVSLPRRTGVARIVWLTETGRNATHAEPSHLSYRPGERPKAEPEFPKLVATRDGRDRLEGVYHAPPDATQARIELWFRWGEPHSSVRWTMPTMERTEAPVPRTVRLATVHYRPRDGHTAKEKREQFAPLIENAAKQGADLIVGKYRKVTLPRSEIEGGITPGDKYPVFETRFGKVGMMVCYDGFFPEVARELSNRGAEVIAWPVWGCNPLLASARACENHVFLVSSTYMDVSDNWALSAIYGRDGKTMAHAEDWGTVSMAEVDLGKPLYWQSLGDFQAEIQAHRPVVDPVP